MSFRTYVLEQNQAKEGGNIAVQRLWFLGIYRGLLHVILSVPFFVIFKYKK